MHSFYKTLPSDYLGKLSNQLLFITWVGGGGGVTWFSGATGDSWSSTEYKGGTIDNNTER